MNNSLVNNNSFMWFANIVFLFKLIGVLFLFNTIRSSLILIHSLKNRRNTFVNTLVCRLIRFISKKFTSSLPLLLVPLRVLRLAHGMENS